MTEKMQKLWKSLDRIVLVNQRELALGIAACTLGGIVAGMLLSPKKTVTIGSNNSGNCAALPSEIGVPADEEGTVEE